MEVKDLLNFFWNNRYLRNSTEYIKVQKIFLKHTTLFLIK